MRCWSDTDVALVGARGKRDGAHKVDFSSLDGKSVVDVADVVDADSYGTVLDVVAGHDLELVHAEADVAEGARKVDLVEHLYHSRHLLQGHLPHKPHHVHTKPKNLPILKNFENVRAAAPHHHLAHFP